MRCGDEKFSPTAPEVPELSEFAPVAGDDGTDLDFDKEILLLLFDIFAFTRAVGEPEFGRDDTLDILFCNKSPLLLDPATWRVLLDEIFPFSAAEVGIEAIAVHGQGAALTIDAIGGGPSGRPKTPPTPTRNLDFATAFPPLALVVAGDGGRSSRLFTRLDTGMEEE